MVWHLVFEDFAIGCKFKFLVKRRGCGDDVSNCKTIFNLLPVCMALENCDRVTFHYLLAFAADVNSVQWYYIFRRLSNRHGPMMTGTSSG